MAVAILVLVMLVLVLVIRLLVLMLLVLVMLVLVIVVLVMFALVMFGVGGNSGGDSNAMLKWWCCIYLARFVNARRRVSPSIYAMIFERHSHIFLRLQRK